MPQATDNKGSPAKRSEATPLEAYYTQPELWDLERYEGSADQRLRARMVAAMVDPQAETVLDVGCGNGFVTRRLRASRLVVGLDPSEEALSHYDGVRVLASGGELPFPDQSFDAVVCVEVLEHLSDELFGKVTNELARVARNRIVIGVPYKEDLLRSMSTCAVCGSRYHNDLHRHSFTQPEEVSRLFLGLAPEAVVLLGRRAQIRSRLFPWLRYRVIGPYSASPYARCPNCGSAARAGKKGIRAILASFFESVAWRLPKRTVSKWMLVLLCREGARQE